MIKNNSDFWTNKKIRSYVLRGSSQFTIGIKGKDSFCYRVGKLRKKRDPGNRTRIFFVRSISGEHRNVREDYIGTIFIDKINIAGSFKLTQKSTFSSDHPAFRAFDWFWFKLNSAKEPLGVLVDNWRFLQARYCKKCGSSLIDQEEIVSGLGFSCDPEAIAANKVPPKKEQNGAENKWNRKIKTFKAKEPTNIFKEQIEKEAVDSKNKNKRFIDL